MHDFKQQALKLAGAAKQIADHTGISDEEKLAQLKQVAAAANATEAERKRAELEAQISEQQKQIAELEKQKAALV